MNIHTIQIKKKNERKPTRTASRRTGSQRFAVVFKIVALLFVVFVIASARALFNSETEKLNRKSLDLQAKIHSFNREIDNLQIKKEEYCGRYILHQIKILDLKLKSPLAGQVKRINLPVAARSQKKNIESSNYLLTQR